MLLPSYPLDGASAATRRGAGTACRRAGRGAQVTRFSGAALETEVGQELLDVLFTAGGAAFRRIVTPAGEVFELLSTILASIFIKGHR